MELLLLSVPNAIFRDEILPFLDIKDIAILDSATANKSLRKSFHRRLLKRALLGSQTIKLNTSAIKWLNIRRISLANMTFHETITENDILSLVNIIHTVRYINFQNCCNYT